MKNTGGKLILLAAILFAVLHAPSQVSAQEPPAFVDLSFRWCPPGATNVFLECHDNPIIGLDVSLGYEGGPVIGNCTTDEIVDCAFSVSAGSYTWSYDPLPGGIPAWPADFLGSYCSEEGARGVYLEDDAHVFPVSFGDHVTCDIYFVNHELAPVNQGGATDAGADSGAHALPNTGVGPTRDGSNGFALLLVAAMALGGLGVATRKVSIR